MAYKKLVECLDDGMLSEQEIREYLDNEGCNPVEVDYAFRTAGEEGKLNWEENALNLGQVYMDHYRNLRPSELRVLLRERGYEDSQIDYAVNNIFQYLQK